MRDHLGLGHVAGVDHQRVVGGTAAATPPASNPGGHGAAHRPARLRSRRPGRSPRSGRCGDAPALRPMRSGRSSHRHPAARPCRCHGPRPRRCRARRPAHAAAPPNAPGRRAPPTPPTPPWSPRHRGSQPKHLLRQGKRDPRRGHSQPTAEHRQRPLRWPECRSGRRRPAARPASRSGTSRRYPDSARPVTAPNPVTPRTSRFPRVRQRRSTSESRHRPTALYSSPISLRLNTRMLPGR